MDAGVDYTVPEKQPDIVGCQIISITIDPSNGTWSGVCSRIDGGVVQSSYVVLGVPIAMVDVGTIIDILVAAAQATVPPQIPPGKVVIKP
jgi:hypothetical protein